MSLNMTLYVYILKTNLNFDAMLFTYLNLFTFLHSGQFFWMNVGLNMLVWGNFILLWCFEVAIYFSGILQSAEIGKLQKQKWKGVTAYLQPNIYN